ncbi:hypothetical protein [Solidesulfovibrio alcoholivorans]|uniref:hypothetical protein n=1 Tax=Solidesulfovibrio alcoholivorans TaxID=81406 RepID=UPI0004958AC4|nr:hypothetical protein [Solidesulfovibrio alcoholivorans]
MHVKIQCSACRPLCLVLFVLALASCAPQPQMAPLFFAWSFRPDATGAQAASIINHLSPADQQALAQALLTLPPDTKSFTQISANPNPVIVIRHPDPGFEIIYPSPVPGALPLTWIQGTVKPGHLINVHVNTPADPVLTQRNLGMTYGQVSGIHLQ